MRLLILTASFLFFSSTSVFAQDIDFRRCPNSADGSILTGYDILYGPPSDKQYIIVDDTGWDLDSYRAKGYDIYLYCHYGNVDKLVEIPKDIDWCTMYGSNVDCR